jgi:hypothetical protein
MKHNMVVELLNEPEIIPVMTLGSMKPGAYITTVNSDPNSPKVLMMIGFRGSKLGVSLVGYTDIGDFRDYASLSVLTEVYNVRPVGDLKFVVGL